MYHLPHKRQQGSIGYLLIMVWDRRPGGLFPAAPRVKLGPCANLNGANSAENKERVHTARTTGMLTTWLSR